MLYSLIIAIKISHNQTHTHTHNVHWSVIVPIRKIVSVENAWANFNGTISCISWRAKKLVFVWKVFVQYCCCCCCCGVHCLISIKSMSMSTEMNCILLLFAPWSNALHWRYKARFQNFNDFCVSKSRTAFTVLLQFNLFRWSQLPFMFFLRILTRMHISTKCRNSRELRNIFLIHIHLVVIGSRCTKKKTTKICMGFVHMCALASEI